MTIAWRLCREAFAELTGEGARRYGGRWNSPGRPVLYTASTAALAVLEMRVHLDLPPELVPDDHVLLGVEFDDHVIEVVGSVPSDPRRFGDAWLAEARSPVLRVPSLIVPESTNLLFNPNHPDAPALKVTSRRSFAFDRRLWLPL